MTVGHMPELSQQAISEAVSHDPGFWQRLRFVTMFLSTVVPHNMANLHATMVQVTAVFGLNYEWI